MAQPKTFRIDRGIGQYDFNDYYAVLGLPVTAEAGHVRRRYINIAKCLHPDVHGRTSDERLIATQYLSKLVNPAYNVLSQERERSEYYAILKLLGKRLMKRNQKFSPQSDLAKQFLFSSNSLDYEKTIQDIAKVQYQNLETCLEQIGLLSELNLAYILLQEGYQHTDQSVTYFTNSSNSSSNSNMKPATSNASVANSLETSSYQSRSESASKAREEASRSNQGMAASAPSDGQGTSVAQYISQAERNISQSLWASALKDLRTAIQLDCNNSKCHALLGYVYLNQKLSGMAKVSFQQALKLNPEEPLALQYINQVSTSVPPSADKQPKDGKNRKGGFFGWLGGG
ncbi:MAG: DnaJ domain-containing protein [Pseudanabaenaceae cyanobacterium bins.39]|nr:DnaJ domain-containing protein [Pseudanabaenaceae cyanobacterium bins.39]